MDFRCFKVQLAICCKIFMVLGYTVFSPRFNCFFQHVSVLNDNSVNLCLSPYLSYFGINFIISLDHI